MDDDTDQAAWAQQEQDERRQREDEALAHAHKVRIEFDASNAEFAREMTEIRQRTNTLKTLL
jgi:hypothetical protein